MTHHRLKPYKRIRELEEQNLQLRARIGYLAEELEAARSQLSHAREAVNSSYRYARAWEREARGEQGELP